MSLRMTAGEKGYLAEVAWGILSVVYISRRAIWQVTAKQRCGGKIGMENGLQKILETIY